MRKILSILAGFVVLSAPLSQAQNRSLKIQLDPGQTQIQWRVSAGLHTIHGTFKLKSGELIYSPGSGVAEGEILVDATTGETGDAARDKEIQNEVLESNRYPGIFFHPTAIKGGFQAKDGEQDLMADGTFNIHGADHALELPLKAQVAGEMITLTAKFTVPYVAWGMKNPSRLLHPVGKQVAIEVTAKGTIKRAE